MSQGPDAPLGAPGGASGPSALEVADPRSSGTAADDLPSPSFGGRTEQDRVFEALFDVSAQPRTLGRYAVLGTLGRGGMGTVFEAFDRTLDRRVAIKVLHRELGSGYTARLLREAQAMARLSHPNVVQVYEVGHVEGQTFVAMEMVEGRTLRAWMQQEPAPSWSHCVEVFRQAGEGLAAAHAQGLIHRDFKPDNTIIDEQGRVRVLDFGLARGVDADVDADADTDTDTAARPLEDVGAILDVPLTRTGAVMGTPAYMPPEQMRGDDADARGDQFSFCASLFEAVYGARPFEGSSMMAMMVSMDAGEVRLATPGTKVPPALRKILVRGLHADPARRWPSMEALLAELAGLTGTRGRSWWVAGGTLAVIGLVVGGLVAQAEVEQRCSGARARLLDVWDDARRREVEDAFSATGSPLASDTWERVSVRLDAYAEAWIDEHTQACEATVVRKEQTEEEQSLRMGCLRRRRTALRATVDVLADADAEVVEKAVPMVAGLPGLARCDEIEALREAVPPPEDPQVAQQVEEVREGLADAEALRAGGRHSQALETVEALAVQAEALGYVPLLAEVKVIRGWVRRANGEIDGAEEDLLEAYALALEQGDESVTRRAATSLVSVVGSSKARPVEGQVWGRTALPLSQRPGVDPSARAHALGNIGNVYETQGEYEEALAYHRQALAVWEKAWGAEHPEAAGALSDIGLAQWKLGQHEDALASHRRALTIREHALGPGHPDVAISLNNLGIVLDAQGEYDESLTHYRRSASIFEDVGGMSHPDVATAHGNIGMVLQKQGRSDEALSYFQRALEAWTDAVGAEHPNVGIMLNSIGAVHESRGEYADALGYFERALENLEASLGPEHPTIAAILANVGTMLKYQERPEEALVHQRRALAIVEEALGPTHVQIVSLASNIGTTLHAQGRNEDALRSFRRALAVAEEVLSEEHPDVALAHSNIGTVLLEMGALEDASRHVEQALEIRRVTLGPEHPNVAKCLLSLSRIALARGDATVARGHAERAVSILRADGVAPQVRAEAHLQLARVLWTQRALRSAARREAELALAAIEEAGEDATDGERSEVERWLAEHGSL